MCVRGLDRRTDDEDEGSQHQRLATPDPVGNWPCYEACSECAGLLEAHREGVDAGLVCRGIPEGVDEAL
jgi:hypothetical protein